MPYKFGGFSFTSYADRQKLIERGLLEDDEQSWQITDRGRKVIGRTVDMHLAAFAERHRTLWGVELVADTYRRFPYFATRIEIAEHVLKGDASALAHIAAIRTKVTGPELNTIGYEGHTLESYLNALIRSGATLLRDVRHNPISRKYGFSWNTLARGCDGVGIDTSTCPSSVTATAAPRRSRPASGVQRIASARAAREAARAHQGQPDARGITAVRLVRRQARGANLQSDSETTSRFSYRFEDAGAEAERVWGLNWKADALYWCFRSAGGDAPIALARCVRKHFVKS